MRKAKVALATACGVLILGAGVAHAAPPQYYLTDLGTLGGNQSHAMDLNQRGQVVGWSTNANGQKRAFLWSDGHMQDLGVLPGESTSEARAINIIGEVVGISGGRAFYWYDGVMTEIPNEIGGFAIEATDISDAGRVCGWGWEPDFSTSSFWWEPEWDFLQILPVPDGITESRAQAINFNRQTACHSWAEDQSWRAYYNTFHFVNGVPFAQAWDINSSGAMTGGDGFPPSQAWYWNGTSTTLISPPPGHNDAFGHGLNNDGIVVGDSWDPSFDDLRAFIWIGGGTYFLDDYDNTAWGLQVAEAINNDGQICGAGDPFDRGGPPRAFLLTPVPDRGFVLMPDSSLDIVHVLDPRNGTPLGTFDIGRADTPIEIIDGNGSSLLLSDQTADTIWRLNSSGAIVGEFVDQPVDNIRGLAKSLGGYIVGATATGFMAWDSTGAVYSDELEGDFFDVELLNFRNVKRYLVSDIVNDNVQSYRLNLALDGQTAPGGIDFPEQVELMTNRRFAVAQFTGGRVKTYDLVNGTVIHDFDVPGSARGVFQMGQNYLLVSTTTGLYAYFDSGILDRVIMEGPGFRYLSQCANFEP